MAQVLRSLLPTRQTRVNFWLLIACIWVENQQMEDLSLPALQIKFILSLPLIPFISGSNIVSPIPQLSYSAQN